MGEREKRLEAIGYSIGTKSVPGAKYVPVVISGNIAWTAGMVPFVQGNELTLPGKVPSEVNVEDGVRASSLCAANMLRAIYHELGSLDVISRVIKITGYVNSDLHFTDQHLVINGASQLLIDVFGESGVHARSAIGVASLPLNACVEIEGIFELKL
jgi:enamine deaminase RidA (YjgF/YER057c/UK114 family)